MRHEAIYALYSDVKIIKEIEGIEVAYDVDGNKVSLDVSAVNAKASELVTIEELLQLRTKRNELLSETDHWVLSDTTDATSAQIIYRQALRDITDSATSLDDVTWPTKP